MKFKPLNNAIIVLLVLFFSNSVQCMHLITSCDHLFRIPFYGYAQVLNINKKDISLQIEYGIPGASILAISDGQVASIKQADDSTFEITLSLKNGCSAFYSHVVRKNETLRVGDKIEAGMIVGFQGVYLMPEQYTQNFFNLKIVDRKGKPIAIQQIPSINWSTSDSNLTGSFTIDTYDKKRRLSLKSSILNVTDSLTIVSYKPIEEKLSDRWCIVQKENNYYIYSFWNGKALSVSRNNELKLLPFNPTDRHQKWAIKMVSDSVYEISYDKKIVAIEENKVELVPRNAFRLNNRMSLNAIDLDLAKKSKVISVNDMHSEIEFIFQKLHKIHPFLYYKHDQHFFAALKKQLLNQTSTPISLNSYTLILTQLNKILDEHTQIGRSNILKSKQMYLPIFLQIDKNAVYTKKEKKQILEVNGIPVEDWNKIDNNWSSYLSSSDCQRFLSYFFTPPFLLKLKGNITKKVNDCQRLNRNFKFYSKGMKPYPIETKILQDTIAVFSYNSCRGLDKQELIKVREQTKIFFESLEELHINHLIIDLSKNGGGIYQNYRFFASYISHQKSDEIIVLRRKEDRNNFRPNDSYFTNSSNGIVCIERSENRAGYKGKIYVLIGESTASTATLMAQWFRSVKRGILIGEETYGQNPCFGGLQKLKLPISSIEFSIGSFMYLLPATLNRGVVPDCYCTNFQKDFLGSVNWEKIIARIHKIQ